VNALPAMDDPVLRDDWHPVAASARLPGGALVPVRLLDRELVLWRSSEGQAHAWQDRCPHRGTRLSIGRVEADQVICAYHGWRFAASGRCTHFPALPALTPPENACARSYRVQERYGLIWVCVGTPDREPPPFPEYGDANLRKVVCGPYDVATSGPRIVENFLDMAHFPFVHAGILGEEPRNEVGDYDVAPFDDGVGGVGILASKCFFWQPRTNSLARSGTNVEYTYRVVRPLTAILTKIPEQQGGFHEAISLHVNPVAEDQSVVWILLALTNFEQTDDDLRHFQDSIFLQDQPIVENQVPKRLPLEQGAELPIRSDRMSLAYRGYLRAQGLHYGVT
jgi:phenylpropionate dioxygenase-like ring-hydroxylating dioxygenase large terminal subunit